MVIKEGCEQPDRVGSAAHASHDGVWQSTGQLKALRACFVTDPSAEIADHCREGMWPSGRTKQVRSVIDSGHPVAQGFVDRIFQGATARLHGDHLSAEQLHPGDIEGLSLSVDLTHVDLTVQVEVRRCSRAGHAVLTSSGLGYDPGLAHPLGQECLAQHIADLVSSGVIEVLTLEQDPGTQHLGEPGSLVQPAGRARIIGADALELGDEAWIRHRLSTSLVQLQQCSHQRFGHELPAESPEVSSGIGRGHGLKHRFSSGHSIGVRRLGEHHP